MTFISYTHFFTRLSIPVLKNPCRKFSHVLCSQIKHASTSREILRRCFSEKPEDLSATITENDFETYEQTSKYKDVDFESIANGDPEIIKTLKQIQLEIDIHGQSGGLVPSNISSSHWMTLLSLPSKSQRVKLLRSLWNVERRKLNVKRKQELNRKNFEERKSTREPRTNLPTNSPVEYGIARTTLFHRILEPDMKKLYNFRLLQAEMFGPHLIIDCGYDKFMDHSDFTFCAKDMSKSWSENREYFYPFDIIFCNLDRNSKLFPRLCGVLPTIERDPAFPFNYTDKHYLDLFPKEKLVYLTPHSTEELQSYEGDSIYIIGGLSDTNRDMALSLAKAKREGLRTAKLPLDVYVKWKFGKKTISISECVAIMNDLKDGRSWHFALRQIRNKQMAASEMKN